MITGVAIRNESITISLPKPNRHCDCFFYAKSIGIDIGKERLGARGTDQGFVTHTGKYLNRMQAAKYVKRNKQETVNDIRGARVILSEDLW